MPPSTRPRRPLALTGPGPHVPAAGGYSVPAYVTTAAIGVGTVLGSHIGGAAQRRWTPPAGDS
ncbi:hypothetical protein ABZ154_34320 [Streptomyces sp. NPDC006261]|uniref:hypothetical protein n=1 Tax=Streptomyces sp. NPDC006261 TaxID=3156739 RepID=UPI00339EE569